MSAMQQDVWSALLPHVDADIGGSKRFRLWPGLPGHLCPRRPSSQMLSAIEKRAAPYVFASAEEVECHLEAFDVQHPVSILSISACPRPT